MFKIQSVTLQGHTLWLWGECVGAAAAAVAAATIAVVAVVAVAACTLMKHWVLFPLISTSLSFRNWKKVGQNTISTSEECEFLPTLTQLLSKSFDNGVLTGWTTCYKSSLWPYQSTLFPNKSIKYYFPLKTSVRCYTSPSTCLPFCHHSEKWVWQNMWASIAQLWECRQIQNMNL